MSRMEEPCLVNGVAAVEPAADERLKVLIIESRQIFKECLSYYLSQQSIETVSIATAREWSKLPAKQSRLDLILLCVAEGESLPVDLSEAVGYAEDLKTLPVVVMSNDRSPSQVLSML
jgi:DNA-binding NarL/FixJ family response regulator